MKRRDTYLEIERDGWFVPYFTLSRWDELHISCQETLRVTLESLEAPHDCTVVWLVDSLALAAGEDSNLGGVAWDWDFAYHIGSKVALFEDRLDSDTDLNLVLVWVLLDDWHNLEGKIDVL